MSNFVHAQSQLLSSNWKFKQVGESQWHNAQVPGTVHTDLLQNNLIPDPFFRDNETKVQWVSQADWEYTCDFNALPSMHYVCFKGLDTYAKVFLNDSLILNADNMFRTWNVEVSKLLKRKHNVLYIVFQNAERVADSLAKKALPLIRPCENNRHYVRKAQYNFGWDFAPKLITCGIWRPIELRQSLKKVKPALDSVPIHLVQQHDTIGESFYFTRNGKPVFMQGANWIPADVFLPRVTKDKYRSLLLAAKEAHFTMLRVWGGGIYEDDAFYDLCDSLNIYVWQDFMFAGAMYPLDDHSLQNIEQEVKDNILRLRHHKCIAVWCGNNEIDEAWHNWGWQKQYNLSTSDSAVLWNEYKKLFQVTLPSLVKQYDPQRSYISTSPQHGWGRQESMTHGDSHYWGLWWGNAPISILTKKIPRFMSEYGMQAMPNMESIKEFSISQDWDTSSVVMHLHEKNNGAFDKLGMYLTMEKIQAQHFESFCNATQELQSRALATAITTQRNSNKRCMGTLFWQFNDCWPGCTWSVIDYYGRRKKAYYTVKKLYQ